MGAVLYTNMFINFYYKYITYPDTYNNNQKESIMTKKQVFRIYLTTSTIEVYLCSILSTYLLTYIIQQISVGNRSTMILTGSTVAMLTSYILRKRSNIISLRKYFTVLQILVIIFQIAIGISLLYNPLVAGIINTIMGNSIYITSLMVSNKIYGITSSIKAQEL